MSEFFNNDENIQNLQDNTTEINQEQNIQVQIQTQTNINTHEEDVDMINDNQDDEQQKKEVKVEEESDEEEEADEEEVDEVEEEEEEEEAADDEEEVDEEQIQLDGSQLLNMFNTSPEFEAQMNNTVESKVSEIISNSYDNLYNFNQELMDFIQDCYLRNLQYDDDEIDSVRYTIRTVLNTRSNFELVNLISGLLYYGLSGMNVTFENNNEIVIQLINSELKSFLRRSYLFSFVMNMIHPNMEDVKLILSPEELAKIPEVNFKDLPENIKESNVKCSICQDEHRDNDAVRQLPCSHVLHKDCVDQWLTEHSHKCPCCRAPAGNHTTKN